MEPTPLRPVSAIQIASPQVWEDIGLARTFEGPYTHIIEFEKPPHEGKRWWIHCEGASYEAVGTLNGSPIGTHRGIWDAFAWEITNVVRPGVNRLEIAITKNGGSRFPIPQVLSGFLPYVSCSFGGLWQPVWLFETGNAWLHELWVRGESDGTVKISGHVISDAPVEVRGIIADGAGHSLCTLSLKVHGHFEHQILLENPQPWTPDSPHLYRFQAEVWSDGACAHQVEQYFGLRTVHTRGAQVLLNGIPFYPRGLLHWGWYLTTHAPNPSPEEAERELRYLKEAGFNLLKACLWIPPEWYLDLCDRLGVAVWVELPLWLPQIPPEQFDTLTAEYSAIVRQIRHHPSILLWTLGCELSTQFPSRMLERLYALVKSLTESPLVRDNSGGGECYGGALEEYADFADYHLYADAQFVATTFKAFLNAPRLPQPWLQGEFADHDTMRNFIGLRQKVASQHLWWLSQDPSENPQGVRWFYETPFVEQRLQEQGLWESLPEMVAKSRQEMLVYHKLVLETMRRFQETWGYVITGLKDTPIATAGVLDERSEPKVPLEVYRTFNNDTVVLIDWVRRRVWRAGGDRPANPDPYNHFAGQALAPRILLAHHGQALPDSLTVLWRLWENGDLLVKDQEQANRCGEDSPTLLCTLTLELPARVLAEEKPINALFEVQVEGGGQCIAQNRWSWRIYPQPSWGDLGSVAIYEPAPLFEEWDLIGQVFVPCKEPPPTTMLLLSTGMPEWLAEWVFEGGHCVVLMPPLREYTRPMPFWREATHRFLPHPLWGYLGFQPSHLDETLFAFSTDYALIPNARLLPEGEWSAVWERVDTRTGYRNIYLQEEHYGKGRLVVTTLHFAGEHGDTPRTLTYHPAGQYWLYKLLHYLKER